MSLLFDMMEECAFLDKTTVPDGFGGVNSNYTEGARFNAAIVFESSIQARVAEAQGVRGMYRVTVPRDVRIGYNEVFVRISDGKTFRNVSKDDMSTPDAASFKVRVFNAEEWNIS